MTIQKIGALCLPRSISTNQNRNDMNNTYNIVLFGAHGIEIVDTAENFKEAKHLLREYRMAFHSNALRIVKK